MQERRGEGGVERRGGGGRQRGRRGGAHPFFSRRRALLLARRRRVVVVLVLCLAMMMVFFGKRKQQQQYQQYQYQPRRTTEKTDVDEAIGGSDFDVEIGEYQDMEMHEMREGEGGVEREKNDDGKRRERPIEEKKAKTMQQDDLSFASDEDDEGTTGRGPVIQNPTSLTNLVTRIAQAPFNYKVEDLFLTAENHKRLQPKDRIRFPSKNLPASAPYGGGDSANEHPSMKFYRTCAVVLNSGVLTTFGDRAQGQRIDKHDAVFRVNQAPTKYFERFAGKKTTLRVLNRKWTQIFSQRMGKGFLFADNAGASFVVTRARTSEFEHLAALVRKERDGDVKVFSMAHGVATRARWTLRAFREGVVKLRPSKRKMFRDVSTGLSPSSGFIAIYIARHLCGKIAVYGMSLERSWEGDALRAPYHYFTTMDGRHSVMDSIQLRAHESHSFDLEGELVKTWSEAGVLRLCDPAIKRERLCQVYEED